MTADCNVSGHSGYPIGQVYFSRNLLFLLLQLIRTADGHNVLVLSYLVSLTEQAIVFEEKYKVTRYVAKNTT